jgi:hypothetical protein
MLADDGYSSTAARPLFCIVMTILLRSIQCIKPKCCLNRTIGEQQHHLINIDDNRPRKKSSPLDSSLCRLSVAYIAYGFEVLFLTRSPFYSNISVFYIRFNLLGNNDATPAVLKCRLWTVSSTSRAPAPAELNAFVILLHHIAPRL